jgi:hypothetical protein
VVQGTDGADVAGLRTPQRHRDEAGLDPLQTVEQARELLCDRFQYGTAPVSAYSS